MSLTFEEIQNTLSNTIMDMQKKMEEERITFKNKIKSLEETLYEKDIEIKELKEKLFSSKINKKDKNNLEIIDRLNLEKECLQKELEIKIKELKTYLINNSTLNNQLEIEKQNTMQLNLEIKKLHEKLYDAEKKFENLKKTTDNQIIFLEKEIEDKNKDILKYKENIENNNLIINNLNNKIILLNDKIKVNNDDYNTDLIYVKEIREKKEIIKKEKEELKKEKEKYSQEFKKKNEEKYKNELEKEIK